MDDKPDKSDATDSESAQDSASPDGERDDNVVEVLGPEQAFGGMQLGGGPIGGQDRFALREPIFWSGGLRILLLVALGYWLAVVVPNAFSYGVSTLRLIELIGLPVFAGIAALWRVWRLPEERQAIKFEDDGVHLPQGADKDATTRVEYTELRSVMMMTRGSTELLMIDTEGGRFTYSEGEFDQPNGPRRVREELMQRIRNHPEGDAIIDQLRHLEELAQKASRNPTNVTYGLLGLISVIYLYEYTSGALSGNGFGLINLGANSAPLIDAGQWWRLISANFLHGGWTHIFLNGVALFFLGIAIERLIGSWRFLGIFLISALGGAIGSYLFTDSMLSVGSSTALFGLIAAFGVLHIKYWKTMPPPYRQTILWWVVILGLNIGISFLPFVDAAGHFGGLFTGAAAAFLATWGMEDFDPQQPASGWWRGLTGLFIVLFAVGGGQAITHAMKSNPEDLRLIMEGQIERGIAQKDARTLNQSAWFTATDPEASKEELEMALKAAEKAVEFEDVPQIRDTLATVNYRLGLRSKGEARKERLGRAVETERAVVATLRDPKEQDGASEPGWTSVITGGGVQSHPVSYYATQLARFLEVYANEFGAYHLGEPLGEEPSLTLTRSAGHSAVEVDLKASVGRDVELFGLVTRDKDRLGMFRVCVAAGQRGGMVETFGEGEKGTTLTLPEDAHLRRVYVGTEGIECGAEKVSGSYWPTEPRVARLP